LLFENEKLRLRLAGVKPNSDAMRIMISVDSASRDGAIESETSLEPQGIGSAIGRKGRDQSCSTQAGKLADEPFPFPPPTGPIPADIP
jgi:hypothetical protein